MVVGSYFGVAGDRGPYHLIWAVGRAISTGIRAILKKEEHMHSLLHDKRLHHLFDVLVILVVILLVFEVGIRLLGTTNQDGEFHLFGYRLKPYAIPIETAKIKGFEYLAANNPYIEYAPVRGWKIAANRVGSNGLVRSNSQGFRALKDYDEFPEQGILRIAMFGDSFVHGDDVHDTATWAHQTQLALAGVANNEVLNFGVPGYSIGQAFLAYQLLGVQFHPDIVVIGFHPENCYRNVNIYRGFYVQNTSLPFFKPRHILDGNGSLQLINTPTPAPNQIAKVLEDFEEFEFAKFGYFYDPADYEKTFLREVRAFALFEALWEIIHRNISNEAEQFFDPAGETGNLCYAIIKEFEREALRNGSNVYIVHIPYEQYLRKAASGGAPPHQKLLDKIITSQSKVIDWQPILLQEAKRTSIDELYIPHFSAATSLLVANHVSACIAADLNENIPWVGAC